MRIEDVYKLRILSSLIQEILEAGTPLEGDTVDSALEVYLDDNDLSTPLTSKTVAKVTVGTESSAASWKDMLEKMKTDFEAIYDATLRLVDQSVMLSDRWDAELQSSEQEIDDLTDRVERLLHRISDTTGYHSHIGDNFRSADSFKKVASVLAQTLAESLGGGNIAQGDFLSVKLDTGKHMVSFPPDTSGTSATGKLALWDIEERDISFKIQSLKGMLSSSLAPSARLVYAFTPVEQVWKHIVRMAEPGKVSGSLVFKLGDEALEFSRLDVLLHTVTPHTVTQVTPQYSDDSKNWYFFPNTNLAKTADEAVTFVFPKVSAKYVKILFQKDNYDYEQRGSFVYEFGAKEISLWHDTYDTTKRAFYQTVALKPTTGSNLLSSVSDYADTGTFRFNRASCEVCEDVPEGTIINYFLSVDEGASWQSIDPINRLSPTKPQIIDFAEAGRYIIEDVSIPYDNTKTDWREVIPGRYFTLVAWNTITETVTGTSVTAPEKCFVPAKPVNAVLSHLFDPDLGVVPDNIHVWRNVGELGTTEEVRDKLRGWRFEAPYYISAIWVDNPHGLALELGDTEMIIDGLAPQSGGVLIPYGVHTVKSHEKYWRNVTQGATDNFDLYRLDPLFPYNHKLLIEGYQYGASFPTAHKVYIGADRWAGNYLKRVDASTFNGQPDDNYGIFAWKPRIYYGIAADEFATGILVKFNPQDDDFKNERFVVEFTRAKQTWDSVMFAAVLSTRDPDVTPMFTRWSVRVTQ